MRQVEETSNERSICHGVYSCCSHVFLQQYFGIKRYSRWITILKIEFLQEFVNISALSDKDSILLFVDFDSKIVRRFSKVGHFEGFLKFVF